MDCIQEKCITQLINYFDEFFMYILIIKYLCVKFVYIIREKWENTFFFIKFNSQITSRYNSQT